MKNILIATLFVGVIYACKTTEPAPFSPVCTDVVLEKFDWSYCDPVRLLSCGDDRDTLTRETIRVINNEEGRLKLSLPAGLGYCIVSSKSVTGYGYAIANLPDCFRVDGMKVRFSGEQKRTHAAYSCGGLMELTSIEEIPWEKSIIIKATNHPYRMSKTLQTASTKIIQFITKNWMILAGFHHLIYPNTFEQMLRIWLSGGQKPRRES